MNVKELIAKLQGMPEEAQVVVPGYESGYDPFKIVEVVNVVKETSSWYEGTYQLTGGENGEDVVAIGGSR